jgi:hypothetical protein
MSHKAYAFDWRRFRDDALYQALLASLRSGDPAPVAQYIQLHRDEIRDPYAGQPLAPDWQATLSNADVHEYGDFALTRFYDPAADQGIAESWSAVESALPNDDRAALLGFALGEPGHEFDPGRQGSYFQTHEQAIASLRRVERFQRPDEVAPYATLLRTCVAAGLGTYVTF